MNRLWMSNVRWMSLAASATLWIAGGLHGQDQKGRLTVERIYSQPSLAGRLNRGVEWSPDGKLASFFENKGQGKGAKSELWGLEAASGQRRLLVSAEKLEALLALEKTKQTQATGLGRSTASEYAWDPGGKGILFIGEKALGW